MTLFYIILIAYLLLMVGIGIYGKRYAKDYQSSIDMGKKGGVILIAGSCIGSSIGNGFVVGGAGAGSISGLAGSAYGIGCALGALVVAFFLADFVCNNNYTSLADYTKKRYNSDLPGTIFDVSTALCFVGIFAAQLIAGKVLFEILGLNGKLFTIIIAIIVFLYSEMAGVWGSYATSVVQTVVVIVGLVITTSIIILNGGITVIKEGVALGTAPKGALDFSGLGVAGFLSLLVPIFLSEFTNQGDFVRLNTAESAKKAKMGHILSFVVLVPFAVMPALIGVYGATKYGITGDAVFFSVVINELPSFASAVIIVAVLAAIMSTIDALYIAVNSVLINDILCKTLNKEYNETQLKKLKLSINVTMTIAGIAIALNSGLILDVLNSFYNLINAACLVPFIGGILFKKAPTIAATTSSLAGVACVVLGWCGVSVPSLGGFFPCIIGAIVFIFFTLLNKSTEFGKADA